MATQLLLVEDVDDLGRSGEIVNVKPGYARNFLFPKGLAVPADKRAVRMQERLQEERRLKAESDRKESDKAAKEIDGKTVTTTVKVDQEGHMYGSVTGAEVKKLIEEEYKVSLEKKSVQLKQPIKEVGIFTIPIRLKEGVECSLQLKIVPETATEEQ